MVPQRASSTYTKGNINLRIEANTRQIIGDAAAMLGKTRADFMIESARRQAIDVLLDQRLLVLDHDCSDPWLDPRHMRNSGFWRNPRRAAQSPALGVMTACNSVLFNVAALGPLLKPPVIIGGP